MKPNDTDNDSQLPAYKDRSSFPVTPAGSPTESDSHRDAAAGVARTQIDQIYAKDSPYKQFEETTDNPYERTHSAEPTATTTDHFQKYHTAWQDYYQKYYEGYYTQAVRQTQEQLKLKAEMEKKRQPGEPLGSGPSRDADDSDTPHIAVKKLQAQFKEQVRGNAKKVRHSKHFWPLLTGVTVAVVFMFLQYNRLFIANVAAYISPGSVDPQNIIVDPTTDTKVSQDPKLIIPKINVDAPTIYSVATFDNDLIDKNLKNGVVKYPIPGANANPGEVGNLVIGGHSSNDVFDDGNYKFVFVQLEKLATGDTFYLNYNGTRYTYRVAQTKTIVPTDIAALTQPVTTPTVTLITCTPVGTALNRFLVIGEQISPDPTGAAASTNPASGSNAASIPGNSPTLFERILGQ